MKKQLLINENSIERPDYEKAFDDITHYVFKNLNFVKYIVRYGNIKHPGISDLDFILVIKKEQKFNIDFSLFRFKYFLKKKFSNIVFHFPLIINEFLFSDLNNLFPIFKFSCYDKHGNIREYVLKSSEEQNEFNLLRIFQTKFPSSFTNYKDLKTHNFREFLLEINSLKHTFKIFQDLKSNKLENEIKLFSEKIDTIRDQQVKKIPHNIDYLLHFLGDTEKLFIEMIKELNKDFFKESETFEQTQNIWAFNQLKKIAAQKGYMSNKIKECYFKNEELFEEIKDEKFQKVLNSIDEYINLNSKYSIFFQSSTFITLGQETNTFKKIIKYFI